MQSDGLELGQRVKTQRVRRGLTQLQLAGLSTVGVRTIRDLEAGRTDRPHPITIQLLTSALGMAHGGLATFEVSAHALASAQDAECDKPHGFPVPTPACAAVGRDRDVEALCTLVAAHQRLITITGLPGTGKTRLAVDIAQTLLELGGMEVIWIAPEERAQDPAARQRASARRTTSTGSAFGAREAMAKALAANVPTVIVVDDADLARWPDGVPRPPHPGVQVIVTARRPLGLAEERVYPIPPLAMRTTDGTDEAAALRLFAERVNWCRPGAVDEASRSAIAAELCVKLDGNPRLLIAAAEAFSVLEPVSVLRLVSSDVSAAVREFDPQVHDATAEIIGDLAAEDTALLRHLCAAQDEWSVHGVALELNAPALRIGLRIRTLLEKGLIRQVPAIGEPRFQVLELVRSIVVKEPVLSTT